MVRDISKVTVKTDRKLHMRFRLAPWVTLSSSNFLGISRDLSHLVGNND